MIEKKGRARGGAGERLGGGGENEQTETVYKFYEFSAYSNKKINV